VSQVLVELVSRALGQSVEDDDEPPDVGPPVLEASGGRIEAGLERSGG
jgi:hypothetical protein